MFIAALFVVCEKWKQPKFPSTEEWINKLWYIITMKYCSDIKRNKLLIHNTNSMNLENTILSEKARHERPQIT